MPHLTARVAGELLHPARRAAELGEDPRAESEIAGAYDRLLQQGLPTSIHLKQLAESVANELRHPGVRVAMPGGGRPAEPDQTPGAGPSGTTHHDEPVVGHAGARLDRPRGTHDPADVSASAPMRTGWGRDLGDQQAGDRQAEGPSTDGWRREEDGSYGDSQRQATVAEALLLDPRTAGRAGAIGSQAATGRLPDPDAVPAAAPPAQQRQQIMSGNDPQHNDTVMRRAIGLALQNQLEQAHSLLRTATGPVTADWRLHWIDQLNKIGQQHPDHTERIYELKVLLADCATFQADCAE
jgi:hypothetical protein